MDSDRKLLVALTTVLLGFGVLMVHSASITSHPSEVEQIYLSRHLAFVAVALVAGATAAWLPPRAWLRLAPWLFWTVVLLLVLVIVPGVGTRINGAQRWFRYGRMSLQPSELAKIALPLYLAWLAERRRRGRVLPGGSLALAYPLLIVVPLVIVQPDLGTALFLAAIGGIALFVGGWPIRNFVLAGAAAVPAVAAVVWHRPYQMQRITGFLETWADWTEAPYHLKQSLVTLGAGGWWGAGPGRGFQKLSFLPEANTDFVFAVIGEELGLVGALCVLAIWLCLYVAGLRALRRLDREGFEYQAAFTLLTQLVLQAGLNVAVVTALVPPKGIPHPLISYGGSNLFVSVLAVGIVLSLTQPGGQRTGPAERAGPLCGPGIQPTPA